MKKVVGLPLIAGVMLACSAGHVVAQNYQDVWWAPAQSGMGINVGHQGDTLIVAWNHYDADGSPAFMTLSGKLVNNVLEGQLQRTTGPAPGPGYNKDAVRASSPGTARIAFSGPNSATFTYNFEGKQGTIQLQRFTYAALPITGAWRYAGVATWRNCTLNINNGEGAFSGDAWLAHRGGSSYTLTQADDEGGTCTHNLTLSQTGSIFTGSGTFSCDYAVAGNATIKSIRAVDGFLTVEYEQRTTIGETCIASGRMGAVR